VRKVLGRKARRNAVALTIDDGPHPDWTPQVLDLLAENEVRATFSLVGGQAQAYPKLVRRIARAGHGLCNHTMTHPQPFGARSTAAIRRQVVDAQSAISEAAGKEPELFRAPGGDWTEAVLDVAHELGLTPVGWSVDPRDWALPGAAAIESCLMGAGAGDILLSHDGGGNRAQTVVALRSVLPRLRDAGLRFVVL
jgi:peptidoglycan/xylan/chitin deacetylase (PgdA/CDA1 family)